MTRVRFPSLASCSIAFAVVGSAFFISAFVTLSSGCSSGAVCYRQTDCALGTRCEQGQCVRQLPPSDAGVAGAPSAVTGDPDVAAGAGSDPSQTPDAN